MYCDIDCPVCGDTAYNLEIQHEDTVSFRCFNCHTVTTITFPPNFNHKPYIEKGEADE